MSTFLITGSNRGIGLELCRQLNQRGDYVIASCRQTSDELEKLGVRVEKGIDVTSYETITQLRQNLKGIKLDGLIFNAGIAEFNSLSQFDPESIINNLELTLRVLYA